MNSRAKGYRTVRKCRDELEHNGWITDTVEKTGKFRKEKDLFGLFDLIAIKGKKIKLIQLKTNKQGKKWIEPFEIFAKKHASQWHTIEIWNWFDRKGWKKWIMNGKSTQLK